MAKDILVNITDYLRVDMLVYDSNQERVGSVKMYHVDAGYIMVDKGVFAHKDLYIPFRLIRTIDPNEIFLKQPKDALEREYTQPPTIGAAKEWHDGRVEEASVITNGFDNRPVVVNRIDVLSVANQLQSEMTVYDIEGDYVGNVTQYDSARAVMTVEKGAFTPKVIFIPFSLIHQVYPVDNYLTLTLPKDVLKKDLSRYTASPA